jgi:hypothetical protein
MQPQIRPFNDHTSPGVRHLVECAEILQVPETDIFRLAYQHWYERALNETLLEELFAGYLLRQELPGWVRSYCVRVLNLADVGQLDPRDFGVDRPRMRRFSDHQFASLLTFGGFVIYWLFFA